jgi:hypothetical protein
MFVAFGPINFWYTSPSGGNVMLRGTVMLILGSVSEPGPNVPL